MRLGNGWLAELTDFLCHRYGWTVEYVLHVVPAVQVALLWRCWVQTEGGNNTATLLEIEVVREKLKELKDG